EGASLGASLGASCPTPKNKKSRKPLWISGLTSGRYRAQTCDLLGVKRCRVSAAAASSFNAGVSYASYSVLQAVANRGNEMRRNSVFRGVPPYFSVDVNLNLKDSDCGGLPLGRRGTCT